VEEKLARAVRKESAAAVAYWWGVSFPTVIKWRNALGVNRKNNEGSQTLIHAATAKARAAVSSIVSEECRRKHREHAKRLRFWELAPKVTRGLAWTDQHKSLLGTIPDQEVVSRTGHPLSSVRKMRVKLRIPSFQSIAGSAAK
jgi:hypothetical protein